MGDYDLREVWTSKLTSEDILVRDTAYRELMVRASYHFIMGNMMFAVSGATWTLGQFIGIFTSILATIFFLLSAKWLNLYRQAHAFK